MNSERPTARSSATAAGVSVIIPAYGVTPCPRPVCSCSTSSRTLQLSASEQAALAAGRQTCRAELSYFRVKDALRGRDARTARAAVSELLRLRWKVKFALLAFALRWAPGDERCTLA